jgi:hypothetical protein
VRDIIYGHLNYLPEAHVDLDPLRGWEEVGYFVSTSEAEWQSAPHYTPRSNHWWEVEFVGCCLKREMSEHYYRSVRFLFDSHFEWLPRFRVTDQWNLGFRPVDIVLNIGVTIDCGDFTFEGLEPREDVDDWSTVTGRRSCDQLAMQLEHLFGFKQRTKIFVTITVDAVLNGGSLEAQAWMCKTVLPIILPTIRRLMSAGYNIQLTLSKQLHDPNFVIDSHMIALETWSLRFAEVR